MATTERKNRLNPWASLVDSSRNANEEVSGNGKVFLTREQRIAVTKQKRLEFRTSSSIKNK